MKKRLQILLSSVFALPVLVTAPVALAATSSTNPNAATSSTNPTTPAATGTTKQTSKTLAQRIEEYKTKQPVTLTAAQQAALKTKCKASQVVSTALATKVTTNNTVRTKAYTEITTSIDTIIARIKDADVATKDLESQQTKLKELIKTYTTDATTYRAILADLNEVDCVAEPVGFKSALESARVARLALNKDAAAIRTHVNDVVKPSLKTVQTELAKDDKTTDKTTDKSTEATADTTKKEEQ